MRLPLFASRRRRLPASARIHATPDGAALTMPLPTARAGGDLLVCTGRLPGNARVARRGAATLLLADFAAGADATRCALAVTDALAKAQDDAPAAVDGLDEAVIEQAALDQLALDQAAIGALLGKARVRADAIVARDGGCEVRVPTGGVVRPVLVHSGHGGHDGGVQRGAEAGGDSIHLAKRLERDRARDRAHGRIPLRARA